MLSSFAVSALQSELEFSVEGFESASRCWLHMLERSPISMSFRKKPNQRSGDMSVQIYQLDFKLTDTFIAELKDTAELAGQQSKRNVTTWALRNETGERVHVSSHYQRTSQGRQNHVTMGFWFCVFCDLTMVFAKARLVF